MSAKRVEYHQGAIADVKNAVAWYQKRNPKVALDFIEELHRAADVIREAAERWPIGTTDTRRFVLCDFLLSVFIQNSSLRSQSGQSPTAADHRSIWRIACNCSRANRL
jgi:plasmid stabilization system protein ParE